MKPISYLYRKEQANVDKPKKGSTITIKINENHKAYQDELRKGGLKPMKTKASKIVEWPQTDKKDDHLLETAAAHESEDESFDWIIPESLENDREKFHATGGKGKSNDPKKAGVKKTVSFSSYYKKKNGRPLRTIFITALLAVLIGSTIGIFMLKLLNGQPAEKVVPQQNAVDEAQSGPKKTNKTTAKTTAAANKQQTIFVIQGGVFASKTGAEETSQQLASIDIPSQSIDLDGKFYLFLGLADSIENAKSLGAHYKANGVADVFAKPLLLDAKNITGLTKTEKNFFESVPSIYQTLSLATSSALLTNEIPPESAGKLADVKKQLKAADMNNEKIKKINQELTAAYEKVKQYETAKDEKNLTDAQQHLLNFVAYYFSL
jgi:stage II sporulation protein B